MSVEEIEHDYLEFMDRTPTGRPRKTKVVLVLSRRTDEVLGVIKWWGAWRQYVFEPRPNTVFNVGCLECINGAIAMLMAERKK